MTMIDTNGIQQTRGSTLVGALVSIAILSFGIASLCRLYISNSLNSHFSHNTATALSYARNKIESLRYNISNNPITAGSEQLEDRNIIYRRDWQTTQGSAPGCQNISITVQWHDSSGDHRIGLDTLIGDLSVESLTFAGR